MPQSVLEMAKELSLALIETGNVPPEDMQDTLHKTHATLLTLKAQEAFGTTAALPAARTAVDWRASISRHAITCLECGAQLRQLTGRHLRRHNLNARSYRRKFGIPETQPLSARATVAKRRRIAAEVKPWEKSPAYVKAQEAKAAAAKKAGRKKGTRKR